MPAEKQVEQVAAKLKELNPGFDGKVADKKIENGIVTELSFNTDNVTDIAPVRALPKLSFLSCTGSPPNRGKLADISPLRGLSLRIFHCSHNPALSRLDALQGMPLVWIAATFTGVADITVIKDMPLKQLAIWQTRVTDLTPLKGKQCTGLNLANLNISDLSVLEGMPLQILFCSDTQVADLTPLRGMPLEILGIKDTRVTDLSPLKSLPLKELTCDFKPQRDAAVLRAIKTLQKINDQPAAEFWKKYDAGEFK
jgi:Leucine-rich repeat (LRR) protein